MRVIVLTGLGGAGKTTALHALEDIGFFPADNIPPSLWRQVTKHAAGAGISRLVLAIDVRSGPFLTEVTAGLEALRAEAAAEVVFLDAHDEVLVQRYNLTRRTHPLAAGTLASDLAAERTALEPLRERADLVIDTSAMTARDLTATMWQRFREGHRFTLRLLSFGYKRGLPLDADIVLDVRSLPNPFYEEALRPLPGTEPEVQSYVFTPAGLELYTHLRTLVRTLTELADAGGRSSYTVAVGCTGGQHRSVAVVERLRFDLAEPFEVVPEHRDLALALEEHGGHGLNDADTASGRQP